MGRSQLYSDLRREGGVASYIVTVVCAFSRYSFEDTNDVTQ